MTLCSLDGKPTPRRAQVDGMPALLLCCRGGGCPYCNLQLSLLRLIAKDVQALGYRILAISQARRRNRARRPARTSPTAPQRSDSNADALKALGIGYRVNAKAMAQYNSYGVDPVAASGHAEPALPAPSAMQRRAVVFLLAPELPHPHSGLGGAGRGQGDGRAQAGGAPLIRRTRVREPHAETETGVAGG